MSSERMPLTEDAGMPGAARVAGERRALVVDPDAFVRRLLRAILELRGWTVEEAVAGADVSARMASGPPPTLVLAEHDPPLTNGVAILALARMHFSHAARVLMSAGGLAKEERLRIKGLATAVLVKPFRLEVLARYLDLIEGRA